MAELVGVISSIIAIAGVGMKISKTLYVTGDKAINADHNLNRIATNVSLFCLTLKHFATVLERNQNLVADEAADTARNLVRECESVFHDLAQLAVLTHPTEDGARGSAANDGRRTRRYSMISKLRSWYEGPKCQTLLAQLEYLKSTLGLLIQTFILASATEKAKQEAEVKVDKQTEAQIEDEKLHVKTLIIAWQLSVTIMQQQAAKAESDASSGRISPTSSEMSFEDVKHPGLLEATPSTSLVSTHNPHMKFLGRALPATTDPNAGGVAYTSFDQIINQMLGRWTRLPDIENEVNSVRRKNMSRNNRTQSPAYGTTTPPELKLSKVESPEEISTPPMQPRHMLDPQVSNERTRPKTPPPPQSSNTKPQAMTIPPPPRNTANLRVNSIAPLSRSLSTPETESWGGQMHMRSQSPQPNGTNTLTIRPSEASLQVNPYSPRTQSFDHTNKYPSLSPNTSPRGSYALPPPIPSNYRRPHVDESPEESHSDTGSSTDEEGRIGLGIEYRIRLGPKYWDLLDGRIIGPRTPLLPPEPLEYLYTMEKAQTEIKETWVSELAMKESGLRYQSKPVDDEYLPPGTSPSRGWVVEAPLKFPQIERLVERTIQIIEFQKNPQGSNGIPRSTAPAMAQDTRKSMRPQMAHPYSQPLFSQPWQNAQPLPAADPNGWVPTSPWQPPPAGTRMPPSYEGQPGPRPGTAGTVNSTGSGGMARSPRLSADMGERNVHFAPSVPGGPALASAMPRSRERDQPRQHQQRRSREADRDSRDSRDSRLHDDSSDYDKKKKKEHKKRSRTSTAKVMGSIAGIAAMLEGLDAAF